VFQIRALGCDVTELVHIDMYVPLFKKIFTFFIKYYNQPSINIRLNENGLLK
jgi:hypothetical protein